MTEKDRIISAIRLLAGDQGLYERGRLEALEEVAEEAERQRRWLNPVRANCELKEKSDRIARLAWDRGIEVDYANSWMPDIRGAAMIVLAELRKGR